MAHRPFRDIAYFIATGQYLTQAFDYDEFQVIETVAHVTELYEDFDTKTLELEITSLADRIEDTLISVDNGARACT